jgi:hypothetical protein
MRAGIKGETEHEMEIDSGHGAWRWGLELIPVAIGIPYRDRFRFESCVLSIYNIHLLKIQ